MSIFFVSLAPSLALSSFLSASLFTYFYAYFSFSRYSISPVCFFFSFSKSAILSSVCCSRLAHCFAISLFYSIAKQKTDNAVAPVAGNGSSIQPRPTPSYLRPDATCPPTFRSFFESFCVWIPKMGLFHERIDNFLFLLFFNDFLTKNY